MKVLFRCAAVAAALVTGSAYADEKDLPKSAAAPTVALASAKEADGKVSLKVRMVESVPATENRTITTHQTITRIVDGRTVTEKVPVQQTIAVMVMKPARWREIEVKIGTPGVEVRDLEGKEVPAKKLATLLEKETPILLSTAGAVDPFYLKVAKEGTLVVIAPAPAPTGAGVGAVPGAIPGPVGVPAIGPVAPAPPPPPLPIPKNVPIKD